MFVEKTQEFLCDICEKPAIDGETDSDGWITVTINYCADCAEIEMEPNEDHQ